MTARHRALKDAATAQILDGSGRQSPSRPKTGAGNGQFSRPDPNPPLGESVQPHHSVRGCHRPVRAATPAGPYQNRFEGHSARPTISNNSHGRESFPFRWGTHNRYSTLINYRRLSIIVYTVLSQLRTVRDSSGRHSDVALSLADRSRSDAPALGIGQGHCPVPGSAADGHTIGTFRRDSSERDWPHHVVWKVR